MTFYDPFSDAVYDDPYPIYRRLRDEAPAYYLEEFDAWFISRFEDVWQLEQNQRPLTSKHGTTSTHLLTRQTPAVNNLSGLDGSEHTPVRAYFNPHFKPAHVRELEERVRPLAQEAVARAKERGEVDAIADLSAFLSVRVVCHLLGLPLEDADEIMDWVNGYFERVPGHRGSTKAGIDSAKALGTYLFRHSQKTRADGSAPEGSVLHQLHTQPLGDAIADDMAVATHLNMLAIGGTETFPKVFSAMLHRLWQNPDQRAACVADPELIPQAFHETLRIDMPTQMLGRTVAKDVELHGETLKPGSGVLFLFASANRDEREFERPDEFDLHRGLPRILSFGHGQHMCLGAHVARMEGRVLLEEVLRAFPEYEVDEAGAERFRSEFFRGFSKLPIRC